MIRLFFVMGIVLSMVAAGLLFMISTSMIEDVQAKSLPRTEIAKFKAGADLAKRITVVASADGGGGGQASTKVTHSSASASIQNIR